MDFSPMLFSLSIAGMPAGDIVIEQLGQTLHDLGAGGPQVVDFVRIIGEVIELALNAARGWIDMLGRGISALPCSSHRP
jgi:hypothetical protein